VIVPISFQTGGQGDLESKFLTEGLVRGVMVWYWHRKAHSSADRLY
jgi:hypothetical protein